MLICNHSGDTIFTRPLRLRDRYAYETATLTSPRCLQATREANEVSTQTEASTLAGRHADGRGDEVEHGEDSRGDEGEG